jgi:hypothetical protein
MNKDIDKIIQRAFQQAGFKAQGRMKKDIDFKRRMSEYFRERGCTLEEIRIAMGYKSISGVQRILRLRKNKCTCKGDEACSRCR